LDGSLDFSGRTGEDGNDTLVVGTAGTTSLALRVSRVAVT
jgi:hypothetical protein